LASGEIRGHDSLALDLVNRLTSLPSNVIAKISPTGSDLSLWNTIRPVSGSGSGTSGAVDLSQLEVTMRSSSVNTG
jgi:hypothetical protein